MDLHLIIFFVQDTRQLKLYLKAEKSDVLSILEGYNSTFLPVEKLAMEKHI